MTKRTRVSGWKAGPDRAEDPRPMEVFFDGHLTPEQAIKRAGETDMALDGYISVEHQVVDLPKWYRQSGGTIRRKT